MEENIYENSKVRDENAEMILKSPQQYSQKMKVMEDLNDNEDPDLPQQNVEQIDQTPTISKPTSILPKGIK